MKKHSRTIMSKLYGLPLRGFYVFVAITIVLSGFLWWRPQKAHAQTDTFTSSGTWTVPAGVTSADFEAWGAGGAGGAGANQGGTNRGGGGGKGGEYAIKNLTGLVTNDSYTVTVAGTTTTGNGNPSSVADPSSSTFLLACGGTAGSDATTGADGNGATTQTSGCTHLGTSFNSGGNGASGATNGGGGGGGAGSSGAGGAASGSTAGSGTSNNGGNGGGGATANGAGSNGSTYGGAGGGGRRGGNAGGTGAAGLVTVTYTVITLNYDQNSFEFFDNANSTTPGTAHGVNTNYSLLSTGQAFRLRQLIKPDQSVSAGSQNFNEQYADLSTFGSCSAIPGGNWNPVQPTTAQSTNNILAGTGGNVTSSGNAWSSTGNITANDDTYSTASISSGGTTDYLTATNFGFSIPTNSIINGVVVSAEKHKLLADTGTTSDNTANLIKGGVISGTNKFDASAWPNLVNQVTTYGSSSDLWGLSLTASDINDSSFGFAISAKTIGGNGTPGVDYVSIKVYYTLTSGIGYYDNPSPNSGDSITYQAGTDPTDSGTYTAQNYQESDNFGISNNIAANTDGEWDLSLFDNGAPASTTYCLRMVKSDGTPLDTYSQYPRITTASANSPPNTPTLTAPSSGASGVSTTPTFTFSDTDPESDDIQFKINLFQSNCTTAVTTYDMASGQTGWSPTFNGTAGSGLTYTSATSGSGVSFTPSSALSASTTYCWSVSAKDPGGSNTTTTSGTRSFTTASAGGTEQVNIGGGVNITGGTNVY